ncbi:MAG: M14 family zinc carboxypeptidase [Candidatus Hydrogenedentales bacterium]|jgi:hypothetical protein
MSAQLKRQYKRPFKAIHPLRFTRGAALILLLALCFGMAKAETPPYTITADFPGANIDVEAISEDVVRLAPDLRDTEGWWFYWSFKMSGVPAGHTLRFDFGERNPIGVLGPAVSTDDGASWAWLGKEVISGAAFTYTFTDAPSTWFSYTIPYVEKDLRAFLDKHDFSPPLIEEELCLSKKGRSVEALRIPCNHDAPRCRVLFTVRHHACETMASFVLEGILESLLSDNPCGAWFRHNVEVLAIPFMDKDGVEAGDQGKNRIPYDHNRDYDAESIYPETAALKTRVEAWSEGLLRVAMDLHCPYIRGYRNEELYIVGSEDAAKWEAEQHLGRILEEINDSPLPYSAANNIPFGVDWNKPGSYSKGLSFSRWVKSLPGVSIGAAMEIPYAYVEGATMTEERARSFGTVILRALRRYLIETESLPE